MAELGTSVGLHMDSAAAGASETAVGEIRQDLKADKSAAVMDKKLAKAEKAAIDCDCEYSTLERLAPTKHGRLRRVVLEVYATTAHSVVFPRSEQQLPSYDGLCKCQCQCQ